MWERGEVVTATSQLRFSGLQMACDMHRQTVDTAAGRHERRASPASHLSYLLTLGFTPPMIRVPKSMDCWEWKVPCSC